MKINKEEILSRLTDMESRKEVVIEYIGDTFVKIYDNVDLRKECFHYPETMDTHNLINLFDFGMVNINKHNFFSMVEKHIDKHMLMNILGVYFLDNLSDYKRLIEKYDDFYFEYHKYLGLKESLESGTIVVINMDSIRKEVQNTNVYNEFTNEERINLFAFETLIHELKHAINNNILIQEDEIPLEEDEEKFVISYARNFILDNVVKENFVFLK